MLPEAVVQKLDALPAAAGRLPLQGQEGRRRLRRQGQEPALARAELLPGRERRRRAPSSRSCSDHRGPRDHRHRHREGGGDPREQPHQGAPAALQRQAPRRQGLPLAAPRALARPAGRVAASRRRRAAGARDRPAADARRRALLRPVPLGDRRAAHAPPRQQALPAPHVQRHRAREPASGRASSTRSSAARRRACCDGRPRAGTPSRSTRSRCSSTAATTSSRASSKAR